MVLALCLPVFVSFSSFVEVLRGLGWKQGSVFGACGSFCGFVCGAVFVTAVLQMDGLGHLSLTQTDLFYAHVLEIGRYDLLCTDSKTERQTERRERER